MTKNIFAYTEPGSFYPKYVSVNLNDEGGLEIVVRSPASNGQSGPTAMVTLEPKEAREFVNALARGLWL